MAAGSFDEAFKTVAAEVLELQDKLDELSPGFWDCPSPCEQTKESRPDYCKGCFAGNLKKQFNKDCEAMLDKRLGNKWHEYSLDSIVKTVYEMFRFEDSDPSEWTVQTERLVSILRAERNRRRKIAEYNRRLAEKK